VRLQTTLVNFCVTERGLEDQLLAQVVEHERPDLQEQAQALVKQLGEFTITLKNLEDNLLTRLANSQGDILEDIELIENLEETKRTAVGPRPCHPCACDDRGVLLVNYIFVEFRVLQNFALVWLSSLLLRLTMCLHILKTTGLHET
jgi:hypothetical protein